MSYNPDICWRQLGAALQHLVDLATDKEEAKREAAALVIVAGQAAEGETARGVAAERVRVRRELLGEIDPKLAALKARNQGITVDPLTIHDSACIGLLSELRRSVDRICTGEG